MNDSIIFQNPRKDSYSRPLSVLRALILLYLIIVDFLLDV